MKAHLALVFLTMFFGFANTKAEARDDHHHKHHHKHEDHCKDECEKKTHILDVVFAPVADPTNSKFIVDIGTHFQTTTTPPFPAGSHFLFTGNVYPGKTFSVVGPFAGTHSLIDPQKIIGTFTSSGVFSTTTSLFVAGSGNTNVGLASWAFNFFTYVDSVNSPCAVQSIFGDYTIRTISTDLPGHGLLARIEVAAVVGGTGLNTNIGGTATQKTYVDADGNVLIRFIFCEGVVLPEL